MSCPCRIPLFGRGKGERGGGSGCVVSLGWGGRRRSAAHTSLACLVYVPVAIYNKKQPKRNTSDNRGQTHMPLSPSNTYSPCTLAHHLRLLPSTLLLAIGHDRGPGVCFMLSVVVVVVVVIVLSGKS